MTNKRPSLQSVHTACNRSSVSHISK